MMPAVARPEHRIFTAPQKSSATFVVGAPVKNSAGTLVACSVTASVGTSSALSELKASSVNNILGFSRGKATSGATTSIGVDLIEEGSEFIGNLINGTASSAKAAVTKLGVNSASNVVRLAKVTSGDTHYGWAVDAKSTFTASGASIVQGVITEFIDAASTVNGRVKVRITKGGSYTAL
jgi:hypothetical protein